MKDTLNTLVYEAQQGSKVALEGVISETQDLIHHLSMRILVNPQDAQDATQEILILVVTKLSQFQGESAFTTWAYRVATNYLLTAKKVAQRNPGLSFDMFQADLEGGLSPADQQSADDFVMLNELRISCTMAMLLCLKMDYRIAYVLGDILELDHSEAAEILQVSKVNFRKRLSRARADVVDFASRSCGLVSSRAKCSCPARLPAAVKCGRVQEGRTLYAAQNASSYEQAMASTQGLIDDLKVLKLQKSTGYYKSPENLKARILRIVDVGV